MLLRAGAAELALHVLPSACFVGGGQPADAGGGDAEASDAAPEAGAQDVATEQALEASPPPCPGTKCTQGARTLVLSFAQYPALGSVGGSVLLEDSRYHDPVCGQDFVIVAQPSAGTFVAFQGSCTHACCAIGFTGTGFSCPCHGSTYDLTGQVTSGPAPTALQELATCVDRCGVFVELP